MLLLCSKHHNQTLFIGPHNVTSKGEHRQCKGKLLAFGGLVLCLFLTPAAH